MAARLCGVNVRHVYALTFAVSAAFAGAAGIVIGIILPFSPADEATWTLNAFVVVVLGGVGSPAGALIGGLLLGMVSTLTAQYIGPSFPNVTMFLLLVLLLLVRPPGLLGNAFALRDEARPARIARSSSPPPRCWLSGPLVLPPFYLRVGQLMLYSAGLAVAWAILGGFAGYASFGHAAFIGVGAFAAGLVEAHFSGVSPPLLLLLGLVVGGVCCAVLSAAISYPILRLRGTFFAIAMLGVSHVCAELNNNIDFFQGSLGLNFPVVTPANIEPATFFYWLYLAGGLVVLLIAWQIRRSRFGAGLSSIREDEDTARMLGVPTERYKRMAFVMSAVLTGSWV